MKIAIATCLIIGLAAWATALRIDSVPPHISLASLVILLTIFASLLLC